MNRTILISVAAFIGLLLGWVGFERQQQKHVFSGVVAAGVPVGGLTLEEATAKISAAATTMAPPKLTLKAGEHTLGLVASELGWQPDPAATAERAFAVGKGNWAERFRAWQGKVQIPLVAKVDSSALRQKLQGIAKSLEYPPTDAKAVFKQGAFTVIPDKNGTQLDIESALRIYSQYPDRTELEFFPHTIPAKLNAAMLQPLVDQANSLLRPFALVYQRPQKTITRTLSKTEVAGLLELKDSVQVNALALNKLVARMARAYDQLPVDARYAVGAGGLEIRPEVQGWKLNQPETRKQLALDLLKADVGQFRLPVALKNAQVRVADLPKVENLQLISSATTYYGGSSAERIANVHAAARNLDGYIVPAGGVFNFNTAIGNISPENGFREALVISGGRTVKGVGGGVCQVSTTTFRSLYKAGLPVVERNQHAYRVHWYDPIVGFDAAVYQPYLNMRAINDTPGPIVVRTQFTNSTLTVNLYGIPDGRKVNVSDTMVFSRTPHPPAQYIVDRSLRTGVVKQVDWAVDGMRTRIVRTVVSASGKTRVDQLNSVYQPWRAVYQVGPGTNIGSRNGKALASR